MICTTSRFDFCFSENGLVAYKGSQLLGQSSILGKLGKKIMELLHTYDWYWACTLHCYPPWLQFYPRLCPNFLMKILRRGKLPATDQLCPFLYGWSHPSCKEGDICGIQVIIFSCIVRSQKPLFFSPETFVHPSGQDWSTCVLWGEAVAMKSVKSLPGFPSSRLLPKLLLSSFLPKFAIWISCQPQTAKPLLGMMRSMALEIPSRQSLRRLVKILKFIWFVFIQKFGHLGLQFAKGGQISIDCFPTGFSI